MPHPETTNYIFQLDNLSYLLCSLIVLCYLEYVKNLSNNVKLQYHNLEIACNKLSSIK